MPPPRTLAAERTHHLASLQKELSQAIDAATERLLELQRPDGHFVFELEADSTIPSEYVLMRHYLGEPVDAELEAKIARYIERLQSPDGGWPLFHEGESDMSATVKAYFALKMIGRDISTEHMARARQWILARGGASQANVFTRTLLALYQAIPWRGVPVMPIEIMHLPAWFPFHLDKISYWARTVLVPLLVLNALKPSARNPRDVRIDELFVTPPERERRWPSAPEPVFPWTQVFGALDHFLRAIDPYLPKRPRRSAIAKAERFVTERLNGEDGLGAIFPAMVNAVLMYDVLGYPRDHPQYLNARASLDKLLVIGDQEAYCQPCLSPVWDTALTAHALMEVGGAAIHSARRCTDWLKPLQVLEISGDWAAQRPEARPGGWAFQYANPHYPDVDDTAVVVMAINRIAGTTAEAGPDEEAMISRAREWVLGMQSRNGGWGAFDADNDRHYLNAIPFADHGALLDPPTADVSARCVSMLAQLGDTPGQSRALDRGLAYLRDNQEDDGSWFGRWGVNYIYGTWSVLCAFNATQVPAEDPAVTRAVEWLKGIQNRDGGWGEDGASYELGYRGYEPAPSTASQTAWALLGLMAAGRVHEPAVARGIAYLQRTQAEDGLWCEPHYTATGFPRVFYLRYHGYSKFFPLWALARYRNLKSGATDAVSHGI